MTALVPYSRFRAVDDDNEPLVGGLLYSYAPGTSTPKATYTDHTLGTPNTNPIVLNANGEATVYIDGDTDLTLEDATSVLRWGPIRASDGTTNQTQTNATLSGTLTVSSTAVTWSGNPTHSGNHTFTNNVVVNGNTTLGDSGADSLTIGSSAVTWSNNPTHSGNHTFSGRIQVSAQPGFSAYTTSVFNIGQSFTPVDVVYDTEDYDNGACYAAGTGIFTAPVAGHYLVCFTITPNFASGSTAGTCSITASMLKNGLSMSGRATLSQIKTVAGAVSQVGPPMTHCAIHTLAANDTLKWVAYYSDATSLQCSALSSMFSVSLLG